jgi:nicotinamidase-related amidase
VGERLADRDLPRALTCGPMGGLEVDHQLDLGRCLHHEQANTNANLSKPELGYEVTVVKDATADYSDEMIHAALDINLPNYASAIVTTKEVIASISSL